ncbi:MAG TPA: sulfite exporter TauE/SafE family protein [Candidatus Marinimicrobia bacterium]|jgi:uncharacterized membrane protein YfcA|nr:sulfite exporter TauE/SafE family protein [Candidatus Neomarinimicrobiota bacterium]HIB71434.1 sulfite exporter TauE/SafE family protein [Candidatus Neomarinimicrobiota bacterium]
MVVIIIGCLGILTFIFSTYLFKDLANNKYRFENQTSFLITSIIGFITNFFDTLGIGSFAPLTALLRGFKQIEDKLIPGTLNVSVTIPVMIEAFVFITIIKVEKITLFLMIVAAIIGSAIGAGILSKLSEKLIQRLVGIALIITAFLLLSGQMGWIKELGVGKAIGLTGIKLIIAVLVNIALGTFQAAGIGMYAPSMALVYLLGMSPEVAFPLMMASSAFALPSASIRYIKDQAYNRKAAITITLSGSIGVLIAAFIVKTLDVYLLTWLVIIVIIYTGITLIKSGFKE